MTPEEKPLDLATRWLAIAARDLRSARLTLSEPATSAFPCQQAAEKAAKGLLAAHQIEFQRTHDLRELGKQCVTVSPALRPLLDTCASLSDYAVVFRYLDAPYEPDEAEAADTPARATAL